MTVFIKKGDAPLSRAQAINRGLAMFEAERAQYEREAGLLMGDQGYVEWANQWLADNKINGANNLFNHALAGYLAAQARLAQYRLADGRPEITEERDVMGADGTPLIDAQTGAAVTERVVAQSAIDPLPATVEMSVIDIASRDQTGTVVVSNPAITADDAERTAAQAIIDATPRDVREFVPPTLPQG